MRTDRFYRCARLDSLNLLRHTDDMAGQNWARLAHYVVRARVKAGYPTRQAFARAIGVTATTLGVLERDHRSVSDNTLAAIEEELRWMPGSAEHVLAGGQPTLVEDAAEPVTRVFGDPREQQLWDALVAAGFPEDERVKVIVFLRTDADVRRRAIG